MDQYPYGKKYVLGLPGTRLPSEVEAKTYEDYVKQYRWHPEAKSLAPDGSPCIAQTVGLLHRTPVNAEVFRYIGKESNRRWEQGEDISLLMPTLVEYRPNETKRLAIDPEIQIASRRFSIRNLAKAAGVTEKTVKAARRGDRLRKSTIQLLVAALKSSGLNI